MDFTPSSGAELQTEYFVPIEHAYDALLAVEELRDRITPLLYITELRTVDADRHWLSMAFDRQSLAIHFTWKPDWEHVRALLPQIEQRLRPFQPRPHWGKLFTMSPAEVRGVYPHRNLKDFLDLRQRYDPRALLDNELLQTYFSR
jgi:xylitol oxidase